MTNDKIYVFGHQLPDTDSVTSAISLAYLKRKLGYNAIARVLGEVNKETKFVLKYFQMEAPAYLDSVKLQIKDVEYYKGYSVYDTDTIMAVYKYFEEKSITGAPVVDANKKIVGVITSKDIAKKLISDDCDYVSTSYDNLLKSVDGVEIFRFNNDINGKVYINNIENDENSILITDNLNINNLDNINTIIILGEINNSYIEILKEKRINLIKTSLKLNSVSRKVILSEYIRNLMNNNLFYKFNQNYNFYDFLKEARRLGHNNYPVVGKNNECLGLIRVTDRNVKHNKKVILVDHNELEQSVEGLNEADIIEVVDHHKIGDLSTNDPINFRNMAVGSTNTIVFQMFKECNIDIPYNIAGMMISGILSDTLCLTSITTTELDKFTVSILANMMNLDYKAYYREMLKAGTSIDGLTKKEVLTHDYKKFQVDSKKYAVGQTITLDIDEIMKDKNEYLTIMEESKYNQELEFILFVITDVIKNGSYILYTSGCEDMLKECFKLEEVYEGVFVKGMTSRKKQIIPFINDYIK